MTVEAGLRADRCLRLSLRATANKAYAREAEPAAKAARKGEEVAVDPRRLRQAALPERLRERACRSGEDTGRLAEVMRKQAEYYRDEAKRKFDAPVVRSPAGWSTRWSASCSSS